MKTLINLLKRLFKRPPEKSLWLQIASNECEGRLMEVERRRK